MPEPIPRKLFYKMAEVCQLTDTQPYVLRFWESEFSQLAPTRGNNGQRLYRKRDIDLVLQIKKLLHEQGFTIAGVRSKLGFEDEDDGPVPVPSKRAAAGPHPAPGRNLTHALEEILRLMDATDRRLESRREPKDS